MGDIKGIDKKVKALQLDTEGLLKLLGGTPDDRFRFWEILKGITTPRQEVLVNQELDAVQDALKQAQVGVKALQKVAKATAG